MSTKIKKNDWFQKIRKSSDRSWEEIYRNRWQHDKIVRSTHGVNCTGSCSWNIYVKDGLVIGEAQATDYPHIGGEIPGTEPRGCARGASFSWYLYNPMRVKFPYMRGALVDLWNEARNRHSDPVQAWASIMENPEKRSSYISRRGKGGFRRVSRELAEELIAASNIYTIKKYGPDRIIGFSPIPAMSQVSYAAGSRYLNLIGGVVMSFYDWYCDLPCASPQVWGDQTDVCESADWFNAGYIVVMGSNVSVTRTPDAHYLRECRHKGTKVVVMSPDYSTVTNTADLWVPLKKGEDGAFWLAVNHVILNEFYNRKKTEYFEEYTRTYTDLPFLVCLDKDGENLSAGKFLRASDMAAFSGEEKAEWKMAVLDENTGEICFPLGTAGYHYAEEDKNKKKWRLDPVCGITGKEFRPALSLLERTDKRAKIRIPVFYGDKKSFLREVPAVEIDTAEGKKLVTTVFDLLNAQMGVGRGLGGDYPADYSDASSYTPAWQEKLTGIKAETVIQVAREFAENAEKTRGKSMVIIGAGINHWFHQDLMYRTAIMGLMLTGSVGVNGGGLAHYVGQEKVAMISSWSTIAMAGDWQKPPRLQNTPSFWYMHSDQWRYENSVFDYFEVPDKNDFKERHNADFTAKAVRLGWLPFYPSFAENPLSLGSAEKPADNVVNRLKDGSMRFASEEPDREQNWPRNWFIWRANAIASSSKGHEYFMKHVLGASDNLDAEEVATGLQTVSAEGKAPSAKMDLIVGINFRMDTSAMFSDIILPAATWYEKEDLNTTDMHTFVHPMKKAVAPLWESMSDWDTFKGIAEKFSEMAKQHFREPVKDLVSVPLMHDSSDEITQPSVKDWKYGEAEMIPGKTMPKFIVVERDYKEIYSKFTSLGPNAGKMLSGHGVSWNSEQEYAELKAMNGTKNAAGHECPDLSEDVHAINAILHMAPEGNSAVAKRAFGRLQESTGIDFSPLTKDAGKNRMSLDDITAQPRRIHTSPCWSGIIEEGRPYSAFTINTEFRKPWHTLTGRQQFYLDHEWYIKAGEAFGIYKRNLSEASLNELDENSTGLKLNYHTPHGKWNIHSTFFDNLRMLTLSRGGQVIWLSNKDAEEHGIADNDWVEVHNKNGTVVCKTVVSARMPRGACYIYHATERTINVPIAERTGNRGGSHNSLTRVRLKPLCMVGGYGQFSYYFNYWGPTGVNRDSYVIVKKLDKVRF